MERRKATYKYINAETRYAWRW